MTEPQKPERIEDIEKRYPDEWVAIQVTRVDEVNQPLEGIVLWHSPNRAEVSKQVSSLNGDVWIKFNGCLPPGMEVLLGGHFPI